MIDGDEIPVLFEWPPGRLKRWLVALGTIATRRMISSYSSIAAPFVSGCVQLTVICASDPTDGALLTAGAATAAGGPAGISAAEYRLQLDGSGARLCAWIRTL